MSKLLTRLLIMSFSVYIPFAGVNKTIILHECRPDGSCETTYSDGTVYSRCVEPQKGCDGSVSGDVW